MRLLHVGEGVALRDVDLDLAALHHGEQVEDAVVRDYTEEEKTALAALNEFDFDDL